MEVTFEEVRQRLGFEPQRHRSQRAIQRTAPALLALFSVVTLFAHQHMTKSSAQTVRRTGWYRKSYLTFSDALALVRKELWGSGADFLRITAGGRHTKSPTAVRRTVNRRDLLRSVNG
jgi:hypothetical protein